MAEPKSEFHNYLEQNHAMVDQLMRIIVQLYTDPKKVSETPAYQILSGLTSIGT